ncbi:molybdenum cofactor synthesis 2 [Stereum hirsutum FP-91666 SS1]|uniref:molybdenum cofactor synthesis 2 n=1 Tax=Stereum hirsutum (strain FP-91666) TaxID=721885 RepID=UPI000440C1B0|nr:molybdenum cofactor synthesis 2 [Stereum hirsutum FP-91666 SS1]EIM92539.1 molybdenum cofactor synthesis 2 [Stereum hirsutum FP-91666 SS1]
MDVHNAASVDARLDTEHGPVVLTHDRLDTNEIIVSVGDDAAGAVAVFIGTTRNSFKGKVVTKLEYQAYSKLAIKTISDILTTTRASVSRSSHDPSPNAVSPLIRCTVHHRLGTVPVGEPSIVIAVSSPHRREAFAACELILEEVKKKAQIWKREYYEGEREEDAEWKANA